MLDLADAIPLLHEAGAAAARELAAAAVWFSLPGGWTLFEAGDEADALHFVVAGTLVVVHPRDGTEDLVGYVRAGEPVGEMALIAGGRHTASVHALRDTELVRIERPDYERLWHRHPLLIQSLAKRMLARAREPRPEAHATARVVALLGMSEGIDVGGLAGDLDTRLKAMGVKCALLKDDAFEHPTSYFEELERINDVLLLAAAHHDTPWLRLVLRQADRIWAFVRAGDRPAPIRLMEEQHRSAARRFRLVDLVCIDGDPHIHDGQIKAWAEAIGAGRLFRWHTLRDAHRLARVIAGKSVGLVLSGGGARAFAHVGSIEVLRRAGVPIDFIGGASMGAIVAAGVALGWPQDELDRRMREAFVTSNPLGDHRLPVVALTRGEIVEARLKQHFGGALIEDLGLPFFCVSTDLVTGKRVIHRNGPLCEALRASISLPGILPPVVTGQRVLVDGAVLDNLPTDIMVRDHRGTTIALDVAQQSAIDPQDFVDPPGFLAWVLKHGLTSPPPIVSLLMRSATIDVDPGAGRRLADIVITPELGAVEIRDWKAYDRAVEAGREAARCMLQEHGARLIRE